METTERVITPGLMDLIMEATSEKEVRNLVIKGKTEYTNASPKTIRRWDKIAARRIEQLNAPEPSPTPIVDKQVPSKKK